MIPELGGIGRIVYEFDTLRSICPPQSYVDPVLQVNDIEHFLLELSFKSGVVQSLCRAVVDKSHGEKRGQGVSKDNPVRMKITPDASELLAKLCSSVDRFLANGDISTLRDDLECVKMIGRLS